MDIIDEVIQIARTMPSSTQRFGFEKGIDGWYFPSAVAERLFSLPEEESWKLIGTVFPSFGERYLSSALYETIRNEAQAMSFNNAASSQPRNITQIQFYQLKRLLK